MGDFRKPFTKNKGDTERVMHKAVCDTCGKDCEIPFEPTKGKPVLCSDCFKASAPRKDFGKPRFERPSGRRDFGERRERQEKPDMSESVMFQVDKLKKQIDALEQKIDLIAKALKIAVPTQKKTLEGLKDTLEKAQKSEEE